jgi:hypothetical protein
MSLSVGVIMGTCLCICLSLYIFLCIFLCVPVLGKHGLRCAEVRPRPSWKVPVKLVKEGDVAWGHS